jgi:N-acetylmuramoyl-L-alanine amidase
MDNNIHDMPFLIPCIFAVVILLIILTVPEESEDIALGTYESETIHVEYFDDIPVEETIVESETETTETETEEELIVIPYISNEELDLLAKCVMAEAGNQEELGKRLVIDVILNRIDYDIFQNQNSITDVIFAEGQFEVVRLGTIHKYKPTDDIYDLIREELMSRTNNEVVYFRTGKYHSIGTPWQKVGDHYFNTL